MRQVLLIAASFAVAIVQGVLIGLLIAQVACYTIGALVRRERR